jgi:hypothetical protein
VIFHGLPHLNGLFAALRVHDEQHMIRVNRWMRRNLDWWHTHFSSGAPHQSLLVYPTPPADAACPYTDASTSVGYGGFWMVDNTCYYLHGQWTTQEKELIHKFDLGINLLEMATVYFLLASANGNFQQKSLKFFCDNQATVDVCTSYKARTYGMATLLESIDLQLARHALNVEFTHIATELNTAADNLSRGELTHFFNCIHNSMPTTHFQEVHVDADVRNISKFVEHTMDNIDRVTDILRQTE